MSDLSTTAAPENLDSDDGQAWLAQHVADSVLGVAADARANGKSLMEVQNPERAVMILTWLARGESQRSILARTGCSSDTMVVFTARHEEFLSMIRGYRIRQAAILQGKSTRALSMKLDDVINRQEVRDKTPVKDVAIGFGIITDKQRELNGERQVVEHVHRVTIADAQKAIEEARAKAQVKVMEADVKVKD